MIRGFLLAGVLAIVALHVTCAPAGAAQPALPEPPLPPAPVPLDQAAPVPDRDVRAPVAIASQDPRLSLELYRLRRYDSSQGFVPGSRYQSPEDRKPIQTPGVSLRVPLQ